MSTTTRIHDRLASKPLKILAAVLVLGIAVVVPLIALEMAYLYLTNAQQGTLLVVGLLAVLTVGYWGTIWYVESNGMTDWNRQPP